MRFRLASLILILSSAITLAQNTSALINQALDKQVKLQFNNVLPEALLLLGQQTGVRVEADPAVWDLLPWGEQTNLTAKIENQTLREALALLTRKFGLTFVLKDEAVELQPLPALRRLGRRSTLLELQALDLLASAPFRSDSPDSSVRNIIAAIDTALLNSKSPFAIENRAGNAMPNQIIELSRKATLMDALDAIDRETSATWYPWGKSIVILAKDDQVRSQLSKKISARYNGVELAQVLLELSQRAGVDFIIEPGALQRVPAEFRTIKLSLDNASIQQALESISGLTGLGFVANDKGVYWWHQQSGQAAAQDPIVAIVPMDNGLQAVLTQSQLPPDLRDKVKARVNQTIESLRQKLSTPTTQP